MNLRSAGLGDTHMTEEADAARVLAKMDALLL